MSDQHLREAGRALAGGAPATVLLGMLDHQQRIALVKAALSYPREDIVLDENTLGFQLLRHVATALRTRFRRK